ncbi:hypothetical protein KX816_01840 [Sphingosinicellaceae bacterium]|nr:hypothetical protein KX816_01840 [Sphingosinicellaceae bacterium]
MKVSYKHWIIGCMTLVPFSAYAEDLPGLMKSKAVYSGVTTHKMYDLERCMINVDAPIMPQIYRQPDRAERVLIVWDGSGGGLGGVSAAVQIDGIERSKVTFWGREKILRRIQPCLTSSTE